MICLMSKPSQSFFVYQKKKNYNRKELIKKKGEWRIEQNEGFTIAVAIKKDPITSIRKSVKVHEETVRTAIKQDLTSLITLYGVF